MAVTLVDASIKLDHSIEFPERHSLNLGDRLEINPFAASLLRHLVVNHFNLFPVRPNIRQKVCQKLDIPIGSTRAILPSHKKIAK